MLLLPEISRPHSALFEARSQANQAAREYLERMSKTRSGLNWLNGRTVGGASLGLAGAQLTAGATVECGPWVEVPATLAMGTACAVVGNAGGRYLQHELCEIIAPTLVHRREVSAIDCMRQGVDRRIEQAKNLPLLQETMSDKAD